MKRRNPVPVRPHRKRGQAPALAPSSALMDAKRKLQDRLVATRTALQLERLRGMTDTPGEALREIAELWKTTYADG